MSTVRTEHQLELLFPDNFIKEITAADSRDFIHSCFGFVISRAPTVNNDNVDTAGDGAFFDAGSSWVDSLRSRYWKCIIGTPGAAVWQAMMFDGQPASGRLAGAYPNPRLGDTGVVAGTYGDSSHYPYFTVQSDGTLTFAGTFPSTAGGAVNTATVGWYLTAGGTFSGFPVIGSYTLQAGEVVLVANDPSPVKNGPWVVAAGAWTRPTFYQNGTTFNTYFIVNVIAGLIGVLNDFEPCLFQGAPYVEGDPFTPWTIGTDGTRWTRVGTGGFSVVGGINIRCTPTVPQPTNQPGTIVVDLIGVPSGLGGISFTPTATPPGNNSIYIDNFFNFLFIDNTGATFPILTTSTGVQLFKFDLDFTQANVLPGSTAIIKLGSLPAKAILLDAYGVTDADWTPGAIMTALKWARTLNTTPPVAGASNFSLTASLGGWDSSLGYSSDFSQPTFGADQITFWAQVSTLSTLAAITGGHSHVYGYFFLRP